MNAQNKVRGHDRINLEDYKGMVLKSISYKRQTQKHKGDGGLGFGV